MIAQRVEKHIVRQTDHYYKMLCDFCHKAKNLYNHANYIVRQEFINNNKWLRYADIDKLLKEDNEYPDYKQMPTAQCAQQVLRMLDNNWTSFFKSIKDWSLHKDKYLGQPKLPKYKRKDSKFILVLTNQDAVLKNDLIKFPRKFKGFTVKPSFIAKDNFVNFNQVRMIPKNNHLVLEIVYSIEISDDLKSDNQRYLGIDIGLDNLATIASNTGLPPVIINGNGLKSINKQYNKQAAHLRKVAKQMNGSDFTNRLASITVRRNNRINDYMHKASKFIVQYALANNINTLVIGNNKNWKQRSEMSTVVNQSFVGLPHQRLIDMIKYKAEEARLSVVITEESYTSGTSFIDDELPTKASYNKSRRIKRGLFVTNNSIRINADVNASFQIIRKVFSNVKPTDEILRFVLNPVVVNANCIEQRKILLNL